MKKLVKLEAPNNIAAIRKAKGLTQQQLAEATGSHWITISKLERGIIKLTESWMERIGEALDVNPLNLTLFTGKSLYKTHIAGRLHDDGKFELNDENDEKSFVVLHSDYFIRPWYRWFEAVDGAMWPWFQDGDLVCAADLDSGANTPEYLGKLVLAWMSDDLAHFGRLERGAKEGTYDIFGGGRQPVRNVKPERIDPIVMAVFNVPIDAPQSRDDEAMYGKVARQI
ncbi:helix-turn-helix domain-containing protein [Paradevosia shaoguanensis]|uniref:Helix-turn-helix domain-containing protein n=1 Tax=Paradevosia shaoguanensis TaxID=1335043 RepID=A0AA41UD30_9HYPH|nr:helix-turn-helix transcriptional regulator [Paradevosia shaoguanensis]MCF1744755.1 helix-turn-helix domain-containing protein [Paradevosia shaoguanensis]MCI0129238.1 helix-turn-helix domain-containing protein [Paradevosia shaoguanensis]